MTPFPNDEHFFSNSLESSKWKAWSGLAFERVCLQHESQIKEVLGIRGVKTDICSFKCQRDDEKQIYGSQIDLLIVRKDQVINLCEMKFSNKPYVITQDDVYKMEYRRSDLRTISGTDYAIIPTLVVAPSVHRNPYSDEFSSIIEIESLFN